jgi:hypothetical protein
MDIVEFFKTANRTKDGQMVRGRVLANASDGGNFLGHIPHWANCPGAAGLRKMRNPR